MNTLSHIVGIFPVPVILHDGFTVLEANTAFLKLSKQTDIPGLDLKLGMENCLNQQSENYRHILEGIRQKKEFHLKIDGYSGGNKIQWAIDSFLVSYGSEESRCQMTWFKDETYKNMKNAYWNLHIRMSKANSDLQRRDALIVKSNQELEARNITIQNNLNERNLLNELLSLSLKDISIEGLLDKCLAMLLSQENITKIGHGAIFLAKTDPDELVMHCQRGLSPEKLTRCTRIPFGKCLCGKAALSKEIVFSDRINEQHDIQYPGIEPHGDYCIPIINSKEQLMGVLNVHVQEGASRNANTEDFLKTVAGEIAIILEHHKAEIALKAAHDELKKNEKAIRSLLVEAEQRNRDLKELQNQLVQSEKMASIGQLAAGVAHEINNPIGFVTSNVQTLDGYIASFMKLFRIIDNLKKSAENDDIKNIKSLIEEVKILEKKENFDFIIKDIGDLVDQSKMGLERVKKIVMDLRTFARESSAEMMEPVSIKDIIESVLGIIHNEIKYKCELEMDFGELPPISCYFRKISQVLINLIINASQAVQNGGKIIIRTYRKDKYACIDIEDNGCGIPQEEISKIFNPFFTTKEVGKGTGLGLSISYDIVKSHGGDISVESQVGKGTKMTVTLPLIQKEIKT